MITLYGFGPGCGLPDLSPFVTKAETLLCMAGLTYRVARGDPRKAPNGKLPYIDDAGVLVPDSSLIRWHIEAKYGYDFDAGHTPAERGVALAFQRMIEDHAYWAFVDARWMIEANFQAGPARYFDKLPALLRPLIVAMVRRSVARSLHAQGFGRMRRSDIERLAIADIEAIADFLGNKPYLLGDAPCGADATLFAFLMGALCPAFETPIRSATEAQPALVAYVDRRRARYFAGGFSRPS